MKIRNNGLAWFLVIGIPVLGLCLLCIGATLAGLAVDWVNDRCERWVNELMKL